MTGGSRKTIAGAFAPDLVPVCDPNASYDELVAGFRRALDSGAVPSLSSPEQLARRWILLRDGCDIQSGI